MFLPRETYKERAGTQNGIHSFQENASHDERFDRKIAKAYSPDFVFKNSNGQFIGESEKHSGTSAPESGIA